MPCAYVYLISSPITLPSALYLIAYSIASFLFLSFSVALFLIALFLVVAVIISCLCPLL